MFEPYFRAPEFGGKMPSPAFFDHLEGSESVLPLIQSWSPHPEENFEPSNMKFGPSLRSGQCLEHVSKFKVSSGVVGGHF